MPSSSGEAQQLDKLFPWWLLFLALGLAVMYFPSYFDAFKRFWKNDDDSQGPIILLVALWLAYRERACLARGSTRREFFIGGLLIIFALGLYIIGRSQEFFQFDFGSQPIILLGIALCMGGKTALARYWFPACFLIFLIPVPPSLLDPILVPLKVLVSNLVTDSLYSLGYPISRSGVVLVIGQYELLIADACSGLRSMVALTGIGLLYVYLMGHGSKLLNAALLSAAIPIAFIANILRVTALVLITYYFGDQAGGEFHDIAGYVEIVIAFASFFALDCGLALVAKAPMFGGPKI